jgi:hypothetical protein
MISDIYYRDDIGERWFEDHDKLHTWGTCARFNLIHYQRFAALQES